MSRKPIRGKHSPLRPWRICWLAAMLAGAVAAEPEPIRIGSKNSNESYLLSEMAAQLLESQGFLVERRVGLGGTLIAFNALVAGEIDLYMEYTGTLSQAIFKLPRNAGRAQLNRLLAAKGLRLLPPLGFNNTYAIAVRRRQAQALGLLSIGDLASHPHLRLAFSHEFLERQDGWPGLAQAYGLDLGVTGIEHALAYQAIAEGAIDVTDAYSTDGELLRYDLAQLRDDRRFFPQYLAAPLVRTDLDAEAEALLRSLGGALDDDRMQALNAAVVVDGGSFAEVAAGFLGEQGVATAARPDDLWPSLAANTAQHLKLTFSALAAAVAVGLTLSLLIFRRAVLARSVIYACGLLQTVPSIALLALMIPVFNIGATPAVVALFLYSLLPILRNTVTALCAIDPTLLRVAAALGLSRREQLRHVYLPLSMPSVLAGIRTAAVINIGTATLAAFIGAGGLGDPIVTGLSLNDVSFILQGAIPAAILAILTELAFEAVERILVPGHLRAAQ